MTASAHLEAGAPPVEAPLALRLIRRHGGHLPAVLVALALTFLILYPLASVVYGSFFGNAAKGVAVQSWADALRQPGLLEALWNTLKVAAGVQIIGMPVAVGISWLLARTDIPGRGVFEFGFWILFFLPALGVVNGWLLFFDPTYGLANSFLLRWGLVEAAPFDMYSYWGIVFAHLSTYAIAVKVMLLTPAFRNFDGALEEAARICGAGRVQTFFRIVVPALLPAILIVFVMSLIRSFESFEIELFLGIPANFTVYSTRIYTLMAQDPPELQAAGILASSILMVMLPLVVLQRWISVRRSYVVVTGRGARGPATLGWLRWPSCLAMVLALGFIGVLPLALLVLGSFMKLFGFFSLAEPWTTDHWHTLFADVTFSTALVNTLTIGLASALAAVLCYTIVAYCTVRGRSTALRGYLDLLSWLPATVPGIILSLGFLTMVLNVGLLRPLYGTIGIIVLANFLASITLGTQIIKVAMLQIGSDIEEAGRVVGGSWLRTFRSILLPLALPAIAVMAVMVFAVSIRQVGAIVLLSTGQTRPLSILQLEFLASGILGPAAVIGVILVALSLVAGLIVRWIGLRYSVQERS